MPLIRVYYHYLTHQVVAVEQHSAPIEADHVKIAWDPALSVEANGLKATKALVKKCGWVVDIEYGGRLADGTCIFRCTPQSLPTKPRKPVTSGRLTLELLAIAAFFFAIGAGSIVGAALLMPVPQ